MLFNKQHSTWEPVSLTTVGFLSLSFSLFRPRRLPAEFHAKDIRPSSMLFHRILGISSVACVTQLQNGPLCQPCLASASVSLVSSRFHCHKSNRGAQREFPNPTTKSYFLASGGDRITNLLSIKTVNQERGGLSGRTTNGVCLNFQVTKVYIKRPSLSLYRILLRCGLPQVAS